MHPDIGSLVSRCFYDGQLSTPKHVRLARVGAFKRGLMRIDAKGMEKSIEEEPSLCNYGHACVAIDHVKGIRAQWPEKTIMVITFYRKQVEIMQNMWNSVDPAVRFMTVDGSQGKESDIVVLVTVRSNKRGSVGFLRNKARINVAMSRAKDQLIIIAHSPTLRHDDTWASIIAAARGKPPMTVS